MCVQQHIYKGKILFDKCWLPFPYGSFIILHIALFGDSSSVSLKCGSYPYVLFVVLHFPLSFLLFIAD
jgi:hypothetical protein